VSEYDGKQFVGIDLHRRHSVIVRQTGTGERLSAVRIVNDPDSLALQLEEAGEHPEVVLEATYGWVRSEGAGVKVGGTVEVRLMSKV
jgi:hypothetical protein